MISHHWLRKLRACTVQHRPVVVECVRLISDNEPFLLVHEGKIHYLTPSDRMDGANYCIPDPQALVSSFNRSPIHSKQVVLHLEDETIRCEYPNQNSAIRYLLRRCVPHIRHIARGTSLCVVLENDLGFQHKIRLDYMVSDSPQRVFTNHDPVRPGERFVVRGIPHRLESVTARRARWLYHLLSTAMRILHSPDHLCRAQAERVVQSHLQVDKPVAVPHNAERVLMPYHAMRHPTDSALVLAVAMAISGERIAETRLQFLDLVPRQHLPRHYPLPLSTDTLIRRDTYPVGILRENGTCTVPIFYRKGLSTRRSPLLVGCMVVDLTQGRFRLHSPEGSLLSEHPIQYRLPIRQRGSFRMPLYGLTDPLTLGSHDLMLTAYWRSYQQFLELVRLYQSFLDRSRSSSLRIEAPIDYYAPDLLARILIQSLPRAIRLDEYAGLVYYLLSGRILDALERSVPVWTPAYGAALTIDGDTPIDQVAEVIEWLLN